MTIHFVDACVQEYTGLDLALLIQAQLNYMEEKHGIEIRQGYDFAEFLTIHEQILGTDPELKARKPLQPWFDPDVEPNLNTEAFWMAGFRDGQPVYIEADRYFMCHGDFRTSCISWLLTSHCLAGAPGIIAAPNRAPSPESQQLRGRTVCRGEVTLVPGLRFGPDSTLATDITTMALMLNYAEWRDITAVWGLATPRQSERGQMYRLGHNYQEPDFLRWSSKPTCVTAGDGKEMLVVTSRSRIVGMIRAVAEREAAVVRPVRGATEMPEANHSPDGSGTEEPQSSSNAAA